MTSRSLLTKRVAVVIFIAYLEFVFLTTRSLGTKRETQTQNGKRKSPEMGGGCNLRHCSEKQRQRAVRKARSEMASMGDLLFAVLG